MRRAALVAFVFALLAAGAAGGQAEDAPTGKSPPAPAGKSFDPTQPVAAFMRHNGGWSVTLSFAEPVTSIAWRLGETGDFKETGSLDTLDPRTRKRMPNPTLELEKDQPETTIYVRTVDLNGSTQGPFAIPFDPIGELARGDRRTLEMTALSWVSFRQFNGLLLYYTQLMSFRCGIREVHIGIDTAKPDKVIPLPPCDPKRYAEIPADAKPYLQLPPKTKVVTVELAYRDGSVSETKTFKNDAGP